MKKLAVLMSLVAVVALMSVTASAASPQRIESSSITSSYTKDEEAVLTEEAIKELELAKENLKSRLDAGLITQERYDRAVAEIDAAILDIETNGIYNSNGSYNSGYEYCLNNRGGMMHDRYGAGSTNRDNDDNYGYGRGYCHGRR